MSYNLYLLLLNESRRVQGIGNVVFSDDNGDGPSVIRSFGFRELNGIQDLGRQQDFPIHRSKERVVRHQFQRRSVHPLKKVRTNTHNIRDSERHTVPVYIYLRM